MPDAPSTAHALAGATVLCNPSASDETIGKAAYRELLLKSQSARLIAAYLYADAGQGESSTDMVYSGHNLIAENGAILAQSELYKPGLTCAEIDLDYLASERLRMNTFGARENTHVKVPFVTAVRETNLTRFIDPAPFVPSDPVERDARCEQILAIQVNGLAQRLKHIGAKSAVVGVSGGLDSTLALIVAARAVQAAGSAALRPRRRHDALLRHHGANPSECAEAGRRPRREAHRGGHHGFRAPAPEGHRP